MGFANDVPMQMPSLCARCGEMPPTSKQEVVSKHRTLLTRITYTVLYSVPVCTECAAKLQTRQRTGRIIMVLGMIVAAIGGVMLIPYFMSMANPTVPTTSEQAMALSATFQQYTPASIITVGGLLVAMFGAWFSQRSFASWNGKLFKFRNKAFHQAFATLNPSISRKA